MFKNRPTDSAFGQREVRRAAAGREARIKAMRSKVLPPGSYRKVCQGCALEREATVLVCSHCPKYGRDGMTRGRATISLSLCDAFGYRDGRLICDKEAGLAKLPKGSYKDTCGGCHVSGSWLWCRFCKGSAGVDVADLKIQYRKCHGDIGNLGGNLVCTDARHVGDDPQDVRWLPPGSYRETCRGCRMLNRETKRLSCAECWSKTTGELMTSWINTGHCHRFRNNDGRLECEAPHKWDRYGNILPSTDNAREEGKQEEAMEGADDAGCAGTEKEVEHEDMSGTVETPVGMPRGSYMDTCRGCRLSDDKAVLTCSACAGQRGHDAVSINVNDCHFIYNEQGTLRCFSYGDDEGDNIFVTQDEFSEDERVHDDGSVLRRIGGSANGEGRPGSQTRERDCTGINLKNTH